MICAVYKYIHSFIHFTFGLPDLYRGNGLLYSIHFTLTLAGTSVIEESVIVRYIKDFVK